MYIRKRSKQEKWYCGILNGHISDPGHIINLLCDNKLNLWTFNTISKRKNGLAKFKVIGLLIGSRETTYSFLFILKTILTETLSFKTVLHLKAYQISSQF